MNIDKSNNLITVFVVGALVALSVVLILFAGHWRQVKDKEIHVEAIDGCMKDGYSIVPGNFSGSVYRICVEDKGYNTNAK